MFTIKNIENTIIINKSKFITNLFYIDNLNDINKYLNEIKLKYKDATHNCYAYILNNTKKYSDDNEPNGTAGPPILDCLEKNNLNYVLCVVTRYFGGILLGANGLIRAYSNCVKEALKKTTIYKLKDGYKIKIEFNYNKVNEINKLLENNIIYEKTFDKNVIYICEIEKNDLIKIKSLTLDTIILENIIIKTI